MDDPYSTTLGPCFDCGAAAHYRHHVIPLALGGTATVPLCAACHEKVHGRPFVMNHRALVRAGMAKARALGRLRGKQPTLSATQHKELWKKHATGAYSIGDLAALFAVSRPTIYRALARKPS